MVASSESNGYVPFEVFGFWFIDFLCFVSLGSGVFVLQSADVSFDGFLLYVFLVRPFADVCASRKTDRLF